MAVEILNKRLLVLPQDSGEIKTDMALTGKVIMKGGAVTISAVNDVVIFEIITPGSFIVSVGGLEYYVINESNLIAKVT